VGRHGADYLWGASHLKRQLQRILETVAPGYMANWHARQHDLGVIKAWAPGGGYACGARSDKRQYAAGNRSWEGSEDAVAGWGLIRMQLEAMDLYRNNPLARSIVEVVRRYCGHSKPRANSAALVEPSDAEAAARWDAEATDYFNGYWWPRADHQRRSGVTMGTLQDFFVTTQFLQGDLAYVWTGDGLLPVEGMQIRTPAKLARDPNVRYGFRFDAAGRATHLYWSLYNSDSGRLDSNDYQRASMQSVLFCPWYWRPAAVRAVPRLHGIIDNLRDHEEIHERVKLKVKHESSLHSIERAGSRRAAPGSKLTNTDGTETTMEPADWGMRFKTSGKPGEDFLLANPVTPHGQYVPLMEYDALLIAAGVGIPYKAVMNLFDGSWSSNKAVQTALRVAVMEIWELRRDLFCKRFWNLAISQGIRGGHLPPAPVNARGYSLFGASEWTRPYFPAQDQAKEEHGRSLAFRNLSQSLEDIAAEQQTTTEELRRRHKSDMAALQADAAELGLPIEVYAGGLVPRQQATRTQEADE
jgi:hypothetical protein